MLWIRNNFEKCNRFKYIFVILICFVTGWMLSVNQYSFSVLAGKLIDSRITPLIIYRNLTKIPPAPRGKLWAEELYLYDRPIDDIRELADPRFSLIRLEGKPDIQIGETIHVTVVLYDGYKRRKKIGGDLVRVWMKEPSLDASTNGKIIDNNDGSYTAILTAFWSGRPQIVAAIIAPREVTAFSFKRRFPQILVNTAVFEHPEDRTISEETPCNYDPVVPGYDVICNFTAENYNLPWYCGKPRTFRLSCSDWSMVGAKNLWQLGIEQQHLSPLEMDLLSLKKKAMVLQQAINITITQDNNQQNIKSNQSCNHTSPSVTWMNGAPTGYLLNRKWHSKDCNRETTFGEDLKQCLKNTDIWIIGDSTMRQLFLAFQTLMPCNLVTETWSKKAKHRPVTCANSHLNFSMTYTLHQLPFCTQDTPRQYFKSIRAYSQEAKGKVRTVMLINFFAHFLNHHSHVYYETLQRMRKDIFDLLVRDPNVIIIIKGPHAYSFARNTDSVLWMPDLYANIYQEYLYELLHDLSDRVIYLNAFDMTVSSEQWHIHAEDDIIRELVLNILGFFC